MSGHKKQDIVYPAESGFFRCKTIYYSAVPTCDM